MRTRAFTLAELLFAMALLALIALFLMAAIARSQYRASDVECISRLRQIGTAMAFFANDHRMQIPGRMYNGEFNSNGERLSPQWYRRLGRGGYLKLGDSPSCYCPPFPTHRADGFAGGPAVESGGPF